MRFVRFAATRRPSFNVAPPPFGSYTHTFDEPGLYTVTCDIHATVYVAATPYIGTSDQDGRVTFDNVIAGRYKLAGFQDGTPVEKVVEVAGTRVDLGIP